MRFDIFDEEGTKGPLTTEGGDSILAENGDTIEPEDSSGTVFSDFDPVRKQRYHFVIWYDGNFVNMQIDSGDTIQKGTAIGEPSDTGTDFRVGAEFSNQRKYWDGQIGEIGYWPRLPSAAEVEALFDEGTGLDYDFTTYPDPVFATTLFSDPLNVNSEFILIARENEMVAVKAPAETVFIGYPENETVTHPATLIQAFNVVILMRNPLDGPPMVWNGRFGEKFKIADLGGVPNPIDNVDYAIYFRNRLIFYCRQRHG